MDAAWIAMGCLLAFIIGLNISLFFHIKKKHQQPSSPSKSIFKLNTQNPWQDEDDELLKLRNLVHGLENKSDKKQE